MPVPLGLQLTPLNMTMADAQFFELRKYSALQIAELLELNQIRLITMRSPAMQTVKCSSWLFLVDTMLYRIKSYEEEINGKVLLPQEIKNQCFYKFNEKAILRTDSKTQMQILKDAVNNGIYKPNEAREYLDLTEEAGADKLIVNGNYIPITEVGKQYQTGGGEGNGSD